MITIVEPQEYINRLWGKQNIKITEVYRLMKYVICTEVDNHVLLHNVVTGQLVDLEPIEIRLMKRLPVGYMPEMQTLINEHYLVPIDYDECEQVKKMRLILRKLESLQTKPIKWYTILPTTTCNARCYYCFEHGVQQRTMTNQTADRIVQFIEEHCGEDRSVYITWFGGEPTVGANYIDRICEGLQLHDINYKSSISTNGYLFDSEMVLKAKHLWHLQSAQICVDGTESSYNKVKNFVNACGSPYKKILRNIELLLEQGIRVGFRMNFDLNNHQEFEGVIDDVIKQYGHNRNLHVNAYPVIGKHENRDGKIVHGSDEWLIKRYEELNEYARRCGVATEQYNLPFMEHIGCDADNRMATVITPEGALVRCCERFEEDEWVGNVFDGITKPEKTKAWTKVVSYRKCEECVMYPKCLRLEKCEAKDRCYFLQEKKRKSIEAIRQAFAKYNAK